MNRWHARLVVAVAVVFAVYIPARVAYDSRVIDVRHLTLARPDLPAELDGFRIAFIADIQADRFTGEDALTRYVDTVNRQHPDLVLLAGDIISRGPDYIDLAARHTGRLVAPHGVYTCIGDHDNWAYPDMQRSVREITDALARSGVAMVDNRRVTVTRGDAELSLLFVTDNYMVRSEGDALTPLLAGSQEADLRVVITHQPNPTLIERARASGIDLFLAGHTHGGQVTIWVPFFPLTAAQLEGRYVRGQHQLGAMHLIVSSGLGVSIVPFRYNATPTVDVIELRRR